MLVLSRNRDESVMIGDDISVTIVDIRGDRVRLGFNAPISYRIDRKEIYDAKKREQQENKDSVPFVPRGRYSEDNPPLMGDADPDYNLATDMEWWDAQLKNFPQVRVENNQWVVAVAPTLKTVARGKTFLEAVNRCRENAANLRRKG